MIRNLLLLIFSLSVISGFSQNIGFSYQAVVRDNQGQEVVNKTIGLKVSIIEEAFNGEVAYSETHIYTTNSFGLVNLVIGQGIVEEGDFDLINWGENTHFLKTELDINNTGDYEFLGITQLLSVPYALHAETATNVDDADADSTNEIQSISIEGNTLSLTDGGEVDLSHLKDADSDSTNELQTISISNDTLKLSLGGNVDLSYLIDSDADSTNEIQTITIEGNTLSLTDGGEVDLSHLKDADADSTNELQTVSISNDTLYLSKGNFVVLKDYLDNTDEQTLSLVGNELVISNGNSVVLSGTLDLDADPTNEFQTLSLRNDSIIITDGNSVKLPSNYDNDSLNEIQLMSISNDTIFLEKGGFVKLPFNYDNDSLNEIQSLSFTNGNLMLSETSDTIALVSFLDNTDEQQLILSKDSLKITQGNTVIIPTLPSGTVVFSDVRADSLYIEHDYSFLGVEKKKILLSTISNNSDSKKQNLWAWESLSISGDPSFGVTLRPAICWTGEKMIVLGGLINDTIASVYDYKSDSWSKIDLSNIDSNITLSFADAQGVWTGTEMIVYSPRHYSNGSYTDESRMFAFNPDSNSWRTLTVHSDLTSRLEFYMDWTGTEVLIYGGNESPQDREGYLYNPSTDEWRKMSSSGSKSASYFDDIINYSDGKLFVYNYTSGAIYDYNNDTWSSIGEAKYFESGLAISIPNTDSFFIVEGRSDCYIYENSFTDFNTHPYLETDYEGFLSVFNDKIVYLNANAAIYSTSSYDDIVGFIYDYKNNEMETMLIDESTPFLPRIENQPVRSFVTQYGIITYSSYFDETYFNNFAILKEYDVEVLNTSESDYSSNIYSTKFVYLYKKN